MFDEYSSFQSTQDVLAQIADQQATRAFQQEHSPTIEAPVPAPMTLSSALDLVVKNFHANDDFARQVIQRLGGFEKIKSLKPKPAPVDLPMASVWAMEMSIGLGGKGDQPAKPPKVGKDGKPVKPRWDQEAAKYTAEVQCWFEGSPADFTEPDWFGRAKLYSPKRMAKEIMKTTRDGGGGYIHTVECQRWMIDQVIPVAEAQNCLVGVMYIKDSARFPGHHWYSCHAVLVPIASIDDPASTATPMFVRPGQLISMSAFRSTTSTGKALKGDYFRQSRATKNGKAFRGWIAGDLQYATGA